MNAFCVQSQPPWHFNLHFEEFKSSKQALYGDFADTIRFILDRAIKGAPNIPRPQAIQPRPKSIESLERKLRERSLIESTSIEDEIRDLAGVRLIFYTNGDVKRFLSSRLIVDNFTVKQPTASITPPRRTRAYNTGAYTTQSR